MKKFLLATAFCLGLGLFAPRAEAITLLDSQVTNVSSTPITIMTATAVYVQIRSTGASNAQIVIEQSLDQLNWMTVATITNPSLSGELWSGPGGGFLRVTIGSYVSGTITIKANAVRGADILF